MPNVLMVFPRFNQHSFWNLQAVCDTYGSRAQSPPLGMMTVAAMLPADWDVRLVDRNADTLEDERPRLGRHGDDGRHAAPARRHAHPHRSRARARQAGAWSAAPIRCRSPRSTRPPTSACWARPRASSASSSRHGTQAQRSGTFEGEKFQVDVTNDAGAALRSRRVQALLLHGRAVQPRLPVQLRVLRHHRALRPRAALQDERADAGRARGALLGRLPRPHQLRRRQPHRQQEGA